jgi:transcription initiation factor IIE alpha subunit
MRKPKHRPITPDEMANMEGDKELECQMCLWRTTVLEAMLRSFRRFRCHECNGMLRRSRAWERSIRAYTQVAL